MRWPAPLRGTQHRGGGVIVSQARRFEVTEMRAEDRVAILIIAEVLADHLRDQEVEGAGVWLGLTPSDRVRGAIRTLSEVNDSAEPYGYRGDDGR